MSVESITWALKVPVPTSSAKFVLVVLANQANDETGRSFPSVAYLAEATCQDRKTVLGNLAKLIAWGLIEDSGERMGLTKQVVVYRLLRGPDLFAEASQNRNSSKTGTVPKTDGNSTVFPSKESQKRDTEPSITIRNREAKANAPAALDLSSWPDVPNPEVLADWLDLRKRKRAPVTPTALRGMGAQLHRAVALGYDVNAALTECVLRGWQGLNADWLQPNPRNTPNAQRPAAPQSKTLSAIQKLEDMKHGLAGHRATDRVPEVALLGFGPDSGE